MLNTKLDLSAGQIQLASVRKTSWILESGETTAVQSTGDWADAETDELVESEPVADIALYGGGELRRDAEGNLFAARIV